MSKLEGIFEAVHEVIAEKNREICILKYENQKLEEELNKLKKEKTVTAATDDGARTNPTTLYTKMGLESIAKVVE